ncbi:hypothetical protein NQ318_002149 [Aromia moschata]|uniref:Uncharacterized protein n=1 Tax=Aromia moschata TaxID=1265417 RepID=A0AAV8XMB6_9CUCU|nr:hypothetical protein NQ318_002149 [Aromia moschata]
MSNFITRSLFEKLGLRDNISGKIPANTIAISKINVPNNIQLADNEFNKSQHIDLLIEHAGASNGLVSEIFSVGSADTTDIHITNSIRIDRHEQLKKKFRHYYSQQAIFRMAPTGKMHKA